MAFNAPTGPMTEELRRELKRLGDEADVPTSESTHAHEADQPYGVKLLSRSRAEVLKWD